MKIDSILTVLRNHRLKLYLLAAVVYVGIGCLIVIPVLSKDHTEKVVKSQLAELKNDQKNTAKTSAVIGGTPVYLSIARLGINLPIVAGYYIPSPQTWTLNSEDVFTDNNVNPNPTISTDQKRTTFLYGHDIPGILIKTSELVYGDIMTLNTENGYQFEYYYDRSAVVPPTDSAVLNEPNTGDPVELMTCIGIYYQSRHVMYFHLLAVKKIDVASSPSSETGAA